MITNYLVWREIERLALCPSNPEPIVSKPDVTRVERRPKIGSERRKADRARIGIFHSTESAKNERIQQGLEKIYGIDRTKTVLEQANSIYHVNNPLSPTNPEIYELFEVGLIDEALEYFGAGHWTIGRPRIDP